MLMRIRPILLALIMMFGLAACGSGGGATSTPAPTLTPFPTFEFIAPTNPPAFNATSTASASTDETTPDAALIERGRDRYVALECATCHGENGEGTDEGSSLIGLGLAMNNADFISFMRSGGEIGTSHQYSTDRLSERGSQNLYLYLLSLDDSGN
jgi:mono/diheme cytochrome c family protein